MTETETEDEQSTDFSEREFGNFLNLMSKTALLPHLPVCKDTGDEYTFESSERTSFFASSPGAEVAEADIAFEDISATENLRNQRKRKLCRSRSRCNGLEK